MNNVVRAPHQTPQADCNLLIYPNGTITDRGHIEVQKWNREPRPAKRRSAIKTFSRASASRLRRLLAQTKGPDRWTCFGMTLTVPGLPITEEEWRRVWNAYRQKLLRFGNVTLIWRIELQSRGQPHVHCVCWAKSKTSRLKEYWLDTLDLLGPYEGPAKIECEGTITYSDGKVSEFKPGWASVPSRRLLPGADGHAVKIHGLDASDKLGWWRYLAAHTSKSKQAQLGWKGRQWGKMNGRLLDLDEPVRIALPRKAGDSVYRQLKRLTGSRYASSHGRQTWFVHPDTVRRLCEWATGNCQPVRRLECSAFSPFKLWKKDKRERAKAKRRLLLGVPV